MEAIEKIKTCDPLIEPKKNEQIKAFLKTFDLYMDQIDFSLYCENNGQIIATISKYENVIKCLAVSNDYQSHNFAAKLIGEMIKIIVATNYSETFVYTKPIYTKLFINCGFFLIYENNSVAFLSNRKDLFENYLNYLKKCNNQTNDLLDNNNAIHANNKYNGCILINANPFTNGHLGLIQKASFKVKKLFLIVVFNEASLFTYQQRLQMIQLATKKFTNVFVLNGSQYQISTATFPSYFIKSEKEVIKQQTLLDVGIFCQYFVPILNLKYRFVGNEPLSYTTDQYNNAMKILLPQFHVSLIVYPRIEYQNKPISGTWARKLFLKQNWKELSYLVPLQVWKYLQKIKVEQLNQKYLKIYKNW